MKKIFSEFGKKKKKKKKKIVALKNNYTVPENPNKVDYTIMYIGDKTGFKLTFPSMSHYHAIIYLSYTEINARKKMKEMKLLIMHEVLFLQLDLVSVLFNH